MGNLKPIDSALVKDVDYDLISPDTVGGEYIETIGAACENPDGYTSGSLFLGRENGVQHLYRATAAIVLGETIILNTNCVYTTVSGELEGKAEESEVTSLNEALTNTQSDIAYNNTSSTTASKAYTEGEQFILDGILRKAKTAISSGATLVLNSNYENADSVTEQISNLIRFYECDVSGIALSSTEGNYHYKSFNFTQDYDSPLYNKKIISVKWKGSWDLEVSVNTTSVGFALISPTLTVMPSNRAIVVSYID